MGTRIQIMMKEHFFSMKRDLSIYIISSFPLLGVIFFSYDSLL